MAPFLIMKLQAVCLEESFGFILCKRIRQDKI